MGLGDVNFHPNTKKIDVTQSHWSKIASQQKNEWSQCEFCYVSAKSLINDCIWSGGEDFALKIEWGPSDLLWTVLINLTIQNNRHRGWQKWKIDITIFPLGHRPPKIGMTLCDFLPFWDFRGKVVPILPYQSILSLSRILSSSGSNPDLIQHARGSPWSLCSFDCGHSEMIVLLHTTRRIW